MPTSDEKAHVVHTHGLGLTSSEIEELESKADTGDAAAAWRLYMYFSLEQHDEAAADPWLCRAAELEHPQGQRTLAYLIKNCECSPTGFGSTSPEAVKALLTSSARTEGDACYELASAFSEGYFGVPDQDKARYYFERGARFNNRMCWTKLAHFYRHGIGGPVDDAAAYYWISVEAQCVDPRSIGGKETSATRDEIALQMSLSDLQHEWKRVDDFMEMVNAKEIAIDSAPFLSGMIDPDLEDEGRRLAEQYEIEHRQTWKSRHD